MSLQLVRSPTGCFQFSCAATGNCSLPNLGYAADQDVARIDRLRCLLRELLRVGVQRAAPVAAVRNMLVSYFLHELGAHALSLPSSARIGCAKKRHGWTISHLSAFHQVEYPDLSISLCATGARQVSCVRSKLETLSPSPLLEIRIFHLHRPDLVPVLGDAREEDIECCHFCTPASVTRWLEALGCPPFRVVMR